MNVRMDTTAIATFAKRWGTRLAAFAKRWGVRLAGFLFTVLGMCALGALLGAVIFPLVGPLGGAYKTRDELVVIGARTGGFFFLVWAPGIALVRQFMRAAKNRPSNDVGFEQKGQSSG